MAAVALALMLPAYLHVTGYTFNGMLGFADPAAYGFAAGAPAYPEIMSIAAGSWVFGAVIIVGFGVGLLIWLPQTMLLMSRSMFAWSFDRIMPARLSYVDPRTHSPVVAIGDRDAAGHRQHGDLLVHDLVQHAGGAARPVDDADRDGGRRRSCSPTASARWSRTRPTGARSPASRC